MNVACQSDDADRFKRWIDFAADLESNLEDHREAIPSKEPFIKECLKLKS
jgi:hypothetical protein